MLWRLNRAGTVTGLESRRVGLHLDPAAQYDNCPVMTAGDAGPIRRGAGGTRLELSPVRAGLFRSYFGPQLDSLEGTAPALPILRTRRKPAGMPSPHRVPSSCSIRRNILPKG